MKLNLTPTRQCPACQRLYGNLKPTYSLQKFNVYDCPSCKLRFIDPSLTAEQQMHIYQDSEALKEINPALEKYYEFNILDSKTRTYRDYERAISETERLTAGRRLCEIGCGSGPFLKFAAARGWDVTGIDSSRENMETLAAKGIKAIHGDIFQQSSLPQFDVVVLWDVIEHPQKPAELIEKCRMLLKANGILLIATPCYPNLLSFLAGLFYRVTCGTVSAPIEKMYMLEHTLYFSPHLLSQFLSACGFKTLRWWRTETDLDRYAFGSLTRFCLKASFLAARILNFQNRLISISRADK